MIKTNTFNYKSNLQKKILNLKNKIMSKIKNNKYKI